MGGVVFYGTTITFPDKTQDTRSGLICINGVQRESPHFQEAHKSTDFQFCFHIRDNTAKTSDNAPLRGNKNFRIGQHCTDSPNFQKILTH